MIKVRTPLRVPLSKVPLNTFQNFLITGGAGFIGSHLVDKLIELGKGVTILDNLSSGKHQYIQHNLKNPRFKFIQGDLLIKKDLHKSFKREIDTVIHLAANPDISKGTKDPTIDFKQTIIATFNLLMEMKQAKVKKIIFFSGSGVYGDVAKKYTGENFGPLLPVSMYGASKLSAEALISAFSHLFNIKAWIFRPANIVGERVTHGVVFDFIKKLRKNSRELTILGDGNQSKSYLYIDDVLDAVLIAISKTNKPINLFNISSNSFVKVNEIAEIVINQLGFSDVQIHHTNGKVGWPGDVPIVRLGNKKLKDLGWEPKFNSRDAIRKTAEFLSGNTFI